MLYLKKVNLNDIDEEYKIIKIMPKDENGFVNEFYGASKEEFTEVIVPTLIRNSEGLDLPEGYVPQTYFFLWNDDKVVGLFKIRHYLNDFLRNGPGHIGYGLLPEYRGKGYATEGLKLAIDEASKIVPEEELYFSVHKDNIASLRVLQKCGAYIIGETSDGIDYLARIKINK